MFSVAKEKIKPIISIAVDESEEVFRTTLNTLKEPFLFFKKENQLFAYVHFSNQERESVSVEILLKQAKPIDSICHLSEKIPLPVLFQIIGEPFAIIKGADGTPSGYILREDVLAELFKQENKSVDLLKIILTSIPMGIFVVDK